MNPKVAIIIANYNYEDYVIKAINSVLNQTYDGEIRIYVVDDGSSDSSWDKNITNDRTRNIYRNVRSTL